MEMFCLLWFWENTTCDDKVDRDTVTRDWTIVMEPLFMRIPGLSNAAAPLREFAPGLLLLLPFPIALLGLLPLLLFEGWKHQELK